MAYPCCFSLGWNLDFPDFLRIKFYNIDSRTKFSLFSLQGNFPYQSRNYYFIVFVASCCLPWVSSDVYKERRKASGQIFYIFFVQKWIGGWKKSFFRKKKLFFPRKPRKWNFFKTSIRVKVKVKIVKLKICEKVREHSLLEEVSLYLQLVSSLQVWTQLLHYIPIGTRIKIGRITLKFSQSRFKCLIKP